MNPIPLRLFGILLFVGSLVAWFKEPSREIDWVPLLVSSIVVSLVEGRITALEKRLRAIEGGQRRPANREQGVLRVKRSTRELGADCRLTVGDGSVGLRSEPRRSMPRKRPKWLGQLRFVPVGPGS